MAKSSFFMSNHQPSPHLHHGLQNVRVVSKLSKPLFLKTLLTNQSMLNTNFLLPYPHSFDYIMKRRAGKVGPAMAHILLKFWAVYGALQFFSPILALYLSPFKAQSLISCIRAPIILLLCYGHRLPMSTSIYSQYLVPIYDSHIAEIEQRLRSAREFKLKLDTELRQLAVYLLEKMAAGELSSLISIPAFEAPQGGIDAASQLSKQKEDTLGPPQNTAVFANRKEFFGEKVGQSSGRVLEIGAQNLDGAIQPVQISEFPKAAYNDLRALRKQFRERVQKRKNVKITPD